MASENEMSFAESEYWETEISSDELDEQAEIGEELIARPLWINYRARRILWNNRIKKQYRPIV